MLFSIIVPVYNVEKYLSECINSILNQSYKDFELILIDDGSTDNSGKLCDEYELYDERIRVVHKKNEGHTSARMAGLRMAQGEYCCFIDSDDYICSDFLFNFYKIIEIYSPEIIAICAEAIAKDLSYTMVNNVEPGIYVNEKLHKLKDMLLIEKKDFEMRRNIILNSLWSKCFRKTKRLEMCLSEAENIVLGEDMLCVLCMIKECESLYVSSYRGYCYRLNDTSLVHTVRINDINDRMKLVEKLDKYFPNFYLPISGYLADATLIYAQGMAKNTGYWEYRALMKKKIDDVILSRIKKVNHKYYRFKEKILVFFNAEKKMERYLDL